VRLWQTESYTASGWWWVRRWRSRVVIRYRFGGADMPCCRVVLTFLFQVGLQPVLASRSQSGADITGALVGSPARFLSYIHVAGYETGLSFLSLLGSFGGESRIGSV